MSAHSALAAVWSMLGGAVAAATLGAAHLAGAEKTQTANERDYLDDFERSTTGAPTIIVDSNRPPGGARCYTATTDLSKVTGSRRIFILAPALSHPSCFPDSICDAFPATWPVDH